MIFWSDDPVHDAEAWYCEQERRQNMWEARCVKCSECGQAIDPNFDSLCVEYTEGEWYHRDCIRKAIKKHIDIDWLRTIAEEAIEEAFVVGTPDPEDD